MAQPVIKDDFFFFENVHIKVRTAHIIEPDSSQ